MEGEGMAEVVGVVTMIAVGIGIGLEAVVAVGVADLHRTQVDQQEGVLRMRGDQEGVEGDVAGPLMTEGGRHLMTEKGVLQQKKEALAEEGQTVERTVGAKTEVTVEAMEKKPLSLDLGLRKWDRVVIM